MKADGLRVSVEAGKLIADLDAYHYLYANVIPTFVGAFDTANVPRGLYAKEGAMECKHDSIMSRAEAPGVWFCEKCHAIVDEVQWNAAKAPKPLPTVAEMVKHVVGYIGAPPSPLCVKCGKPATHQFFHYTDKRNAVRELAAVCVDHYNAAVDLLHAEGDENDWTAGYNWLTGRDAPRTCANCARTRCNTSCGDWTDTTPPEYATHKPTPTPAAKPKGPTCWKCGKPAASFSGLYLMGVPQSDKHQWCNECHTAMTEWMRKQEILAALAANALDRSADREHAAWVRKQYQRSVDVPLVGTGGMTDTFDPRRK